MTGGHHGIQRRGAFDSSRMGFRKQVRGRPFERGHVIFGEQFTEHTNAPGATYRHITVARVLKVFGTTPTPAERRQRTIFAIGQQFYRSSMLLKTSKTLRKAHAAKVPHALFHFETCEQGSIGANVQMMPQRARTAFPTIGKRLRSSGGNDLSRFERDPVQSAFELGPRSKEIRAFFTPR